MFFLVPKTYHGVKINYLAHSSPKEKVSTVLRTMHNYVHNKYFFIISDPKSQKHLLFKKLDIKNR